MPAYVIVQETIKDRDELQKYRDGVHDILSSYDGEVIVSSENPEVLEGEWPCTKTVVVRFPSVMEAKRWYKSPEYQELLQYRFRAADCNLILVEGRS